MSKAIVINKESISPKETYYLLIVDSSTSMSKLTDSTINGVNEQVDTIKSLEKEFPDQKYYMSFIHFNSKITIEYTNRESSSLEHISRNNYNCSGTTALLDAIGVGVKNLNDKISEKVKNGEASAVVVIITDGEENASVEYTGNSVKSLIKELQDTNRWTFTFIGSNIDSIATAGRYGINVNNVIQFSSDVTSNVRVYGSMAKSMKLRASSIDNDLYDSGKFVDDSDKDLTSK